MILSNVDIQRMLEDGALVIHPRPEPDRPMVGERECPYQTSAVDLQLGDEVSWIPEGFPIQLDLRQGGLTKLLGPNSESRRLSPDIPFVLQPHHFVLGRTHEVVELPIREHGPWLAARVEGRSSYARCGLLVHFTAPTIHAGFRGTITLEMLNLGRYPIALYPRTPICQLIVEHVSSRPFRNDSQFQGQRTSTGTPGQS